jgi:hypothetical protein
MRRTSSDPWAGEKMSRSDAHRRYVNLIVYQLRPMIADRRLNDDMRMQVLKRIVREASRFKYESGMVAGSGAREEVVEVLTPYLKPEHPSGPELKEWCVRAIRAFGANIATDED